MNFPSREAAAAIIGLDKIVLDPGPCLPSKFLVDVDMHSSPGGILSSFIPRQAEQPGCLILKPDCSKMSYKPSSII